MQRDSTAKSLVGIYLFFFRRVILCPIPCTLPISHNKSVMLTIDFNSFHALVVYNIVIQCMTHYRIIYLLCQVRGGKI